MEARCREDRHDGPPAGRLRTGGNLARALRFGNRTEPRRVRDRGGRSEVHVPDESLWLGSAAVAQWGLSRGERDGRDTRSSRLELRAQGLSALLHALLV